LDVKLRTKAGKAIDIEIQVSDMPWMRERILYYLAGMITEQVKKGENYESIRKAISIVILDYALIEENQAYHNCYQLYDPGTGSRFTDKIEIDTLELPKLPGEADDSELWDWLLFFKTNRKEDLAMLAEKNAGIKKAVGVLMELSEDERTRLLYEEREKARRDDHARYQGALLKGREEGRAEMARSLLKSGVPADVIAGASGLSAEEVLKLSN
jgi:predicted transposase/invertase (TIGR01784 family)